MRRVRRTPIAVTSARSRHSSRNSGYPTDPAIALLARVVHGADLLGDRDGAPESLGLLAIAEGFALLGLDDQRQLELEMPVYDALYAWAQQEVSAA